MTDSLSLADISDDELDWEEVDVPDQPQAGIEITIETGPKKTTTSTKGAQARAESVVRVTCHKVHTVCLLSNAWIRNQWLNDELLHARLLSLTPLALQNAFASIHKSKISDQNMRGRLFESAVGRLASWWANDFFEVNLTGHIRNRTFDHVQKTIEGLSLEEVLKDIEDEAEDGEVVRSSKSLMKHALMQSGSRDTSSQLFAALCRALGIPTRLVVSVQSVPWQASAGKPAKKPKVAVGSKKGKEKETILPSDGEDMEEIEVPSPPKTKDKGKAKELGTSGLKPDMDGGDAGGSDNSLKLKPTIKLRKQKGKSRVPATGTAPQMKAPPDPRITPPVFWVEVFSRPDARWLPVDPIRNIVNKRKAFDPTPTTTNRTNATMINLGFSSTKPQQPHVPKVQQDNRMLYVVAFEEDGYARDVTARYAKEYAAKIAKIQGGSGSSRRKGRIEWWDRVMGIFRRPYRLHRDDLEDEELENNQLTEGMPTTINGFKDHPLYLLSRHLKRDEVIHPLTELGKFRGEPVYPRSSLVLLKTAENWMRAGRRIQEGEQPMKLVKARASTIGKQREIELAMEAERPQGMNGETDGVMQGLYARSQTELLVPDPVVNGKIPKNNFGNIDLYVPSMLPKGAAHIPLKGVAKVAKQLGIDYAEAVIGFEFRKRKACPFIEGIVVAAENEAVLLEAYWQAEEHAQEKAFIQRQEQVIKRWTRLVQGLRIRTRLQEQYADRALKKDVEGRGDGDRDEGENHEPQGGGFLLEPDDVVKPYQLPKSQYQSTIFPRNPATLDEVSSTDFYRNPERHKPCFSDTNDDVEMDDVDQEEEQRGSDVPRRALQPKSMRELAESLQPNQIEDPPASEDDANYQSSGTDVVEIRSSQSNKTIRGRDIRSSQAKVNSRAATRLSKGKTSTRASAKLKKRARMSTDDDVSSELEPHLSTTKRTRLNAVTLSSSSTPARVLRPRVTKSASKVQEEKD